MTRIIQFADVHFGRQNAQAISAVAPVLKTLAPDIITVCGDLTQRGSVEEFEAARDWISGFDAPTLTVPGNHDTPLLDIWARAVAPFDRYDCYFGDASARLEAGGVRIAGLNTARGWQTRRNWAEGSVNLDDLEAALSPPDEPGPDILVCHHPFLSPPSSPLVTSTRRGKRAGQKLGASSAKILLTGHVHAPSAIVRRQPCGHYLAISAGTLSLRLRSSPPSFNMISLEPDAIRASVFEFGEHGFTPRILGAWRREDLEPIVDPYVL